MGCSDDDWLIMPEKFIFVECDGGSGSAAVVDDSVVVSSVTASVIDISDIGAATSSGEGDGDGDAVVRTIDPAVGAVSFVGNSGSMDSDGFVGSVGFVYSVSPVSSVDVNVDSDSNAIGPASSAATGVGKDAGSAGDVGDADKRSVAILSVDEGVAELDIGWDTGSAGETVFPRAGPVFDALGDARSCSGPIPHACWCCSCGSCCDEVGQMF